MPVKAQIAYPYQAFTSVTPNAFSIYNSGGTAILGYSSTNSSYGIVGYAAGSNGFGVYGNSSDATSGVGVYGYSPYIGVSGVGNTYGVLGSSPVGIGILGYTLSNTESGVVGYNGSSNSTTYGVYGSSLNGNGVYGETNSSASTSSGVTGVSTKGGNGVYGLADGTTSGGYGVWGVNNTLSGAGITAVNNGDNGYAVYASNNATIDGLAGYFSGNVTVTGILTKGGGSFKIDHPLAPERKYLSHSFVESPDMMDIYNGMAILNQDGKITVTMPDWFQALNRDFRYQLTAVGAPAPNLYIAEEVSENHFQIAGGKAGQKISWQVTGIRQDAFANHNRIAVEENKKPEEIGYYLNPESFGFPASQNIAASRRVKTAPLLGAKAQYSQNLPANFFVQPPSSNPSNP